MQTDHLVEKTISAYGLDLAALKAAAEKRSEPDCDDELTPLEARLRYHVIYPFGDLDADR